MASFKASLGKPLLATLVFSGPCLCVRRLLLVFLTEMGKLIFEDGLLQGLGWQASSRSPGVVWLLLVSRSMFACFPRGAGKRTIIEDGVA